MPQTVQFGPFRFHTKADLDVKRAAFVAKEPSAGLQLVGSSINGQSFQWAIGGATYTDEEIGDWLAASYNDLGIYDYGVPTSNRSAARFPACY